MRSRIMGLASVGAIFAGLASAMASAAKSAELMQDNLADIAPTAPRNRSKKRKGRSRASRNWMKRRPSTNQIENKITKGRWLRGLPIPEEDREALERAQAIRERKNAHRAYMFRRTEEGMILARECEAYYARLRADQAARRERHWDYEESRRRCGWDRLKQLMQLWDEKAPLKIVLEAQEA